MKRSARAGPASRFHNAFAPPIAADISMRGVDFCSIYEGNFPGPLPDD
jgi:hypothetical protein